MNKSSVISTPAAPPGKTQTDSAAPVGTGDTHEGTALEDVLTAMPAARQRLGLPVRLKPTAADPRAADSPSRGEQTFGQWLNRSRRVLLTLAAVWAISVFDFGFTLSEWGSQSFVELNPVAAWLLTGPGYVVAAFKFGLLGVGTAILLSLRRHSVAELACWFLLTAKVYVAVRWFAYFDCLIRDHVNPLVQAG